MRFSEIAWNEGAACSLYAHALFAFFSHSCAASSKSCLYLAFAVGLQDLSGSAFRVLWQQVCSPQEGIERWSMLRAQFNRLIVWPKISAGDILRFLFLFCVGALLLVVVLTW